MKKSLKRSLYWIWLIVAVGALWYTKLADKAPYWSMELRGRDYLAVVPTLCQKDCEITEFYWKNKEWTSCDIKKVLLLPEKGTGKHMVKSIDTLSLKERIENKWEKRYPFDHIQNISFKELCYDFTTKEYMK